MIAAVTVTLLGLASIGAEDPLTLEAPVTRAMLALHSLGGSERLRLELPGAGAEERRWLSSHLFELGVAPALGEAELDAHLGLSFWLGLGSRPGPGDLLLGGAAEATWRAFRWSFFSAELGVRVGLVLDVDRPSTSVINLGAPLILGFGPVALVYTFGVGVPVGAETRPVLQGAVSQGPALGVQPLDLALRFTLEP